jgi:O-antigen/teichoic acid export membrane protein
MQDEIKNIAEVPSADANLFSRAVKGGFWLIILRVCTQVLSFAKLLILCRLLDPQHFGLLGVATLTIGMVLSFTEMGFRPALIQKKQNLHGHLNVAWTIGMVRGVILFIILYLAAPYLAAFFNRPDAVNVIRLVAVSIIINSSVNIGTVYFTKELEFNKQFVLDISSTLVGTLTAICLAFIYRNVWSLVFGRLANAVTRSVLSYLMHSYRPKISLNLSYIKELWGFGKHMFSVNILKFFCLHGDDIFLGKMLGATALGFYQQAFKIGTMVANEIGNKISDVSFPAYSKLQDNLEKLKAGYFKSVQLTSLIIFPIAGGLMVLAYDFTEIVLGEKWLPMVPALKIFCVLGPLKCMQRASVFKGLGRPDILTKLACLRFVLMAVGIYPLTVKLGMVGTSLSVLLPSLVLQPMGFYHLQKLTGIKTLDVLKLLSFPFASTLIMILCIMAAKNMLVSVSLVSLISLIFLSMAVYLLSLWLLSSISSEYNLVKLIRDIAKGLKL